MSTSAPPSPQIRIEPGDTVLRFRTGVLCCGMVTVFSLLAWRLIHLQVDKHEEYSTQVETSHRRGHDLHSHRGSIFDSRKRLLATDEPVRNVLFDPEFLTQPGAMCRALEAVEGQVAKDLRYQLSLDQLRDRYLLRVAEVCAPFVNATPAEVVERVRAELKRAPKKPAVISKALDEPQAGRLRAALEAARLGVFRESSGGVGAVLFREDFVRRYPGASELTHIIGLVAEPQKKKDAKTPPPLCGVAGVEKFFDLPLTGTDGRRTMEVDAAGNELPGFRSSIRPPQNGKNLRLHIDTGMQEIVDAAMDETGSDPNEIYVPELAADRVIIVLFDPATMGVKAIGYRDRTRKKDTLNLKNPAVEHTYEPGSTIKIVTAALALNSGKVRPGTMIPISSTGVYDDEDIEAITDVHAYPQLNVEGIIIHSSNIGAYKLARAMGTRDFEQGIRDFGFGSLTGIEAPYESRGLLGRNMTMQTLSRVAFGYAITVTPAQMCSALGCVINDGIYRPLRLADAWVDDSGNTLEQLGEEAPRNLVSPGAAATVRRAMVQVVEKGTAGPGRSELFEIAGKTGTARKARTDGKPGYSDQHVVSFVGFLPADRPRLAGIVIVDSPRSTNHGRSGGGIAAPLFRRIGERAMAYYEVPPQFSPQLRAGPAAASNTRFRTPLQDAERQE